MKSNGRGFYWLYWLAIASIACGSDAAGPTGPTIEGTYVLERVGDRLMPVLLVASASRRLYIWADTMSLANGVMMDTYVFRDSTGPSTFTETRGSRPISYRTSRDTIFFALNPPREDTMYVVAAGIRYPSKDPTYCPTGRCDLFSRKIR